MLPYKLQLRPSIVNRKPLFKRMNCWRCWSYNDRFLLFHFPTAVIVMLYYNSTRLPQVHVNKLQLGQCLTAQLKGIVEISGPTNENSQWWNPVTSTGAKIETRRIALIQQHLNKDLRLERVFLLNCQGYCGNKKNQLLTTKRRRYHFWPAAKIAPEHLVIYVI